MSNEILDFAFLGAGDMMENPKPNNNPNMGGVCAYTGFGVLDFESTSILPLPKNLLNERCVRFTVPNKIAKVVVDYPRMFFPYNCIGHYQLSFSIYW